MLTIHSSVLLWSVLVWIGLARTCRPYVCDCSSTHGLSGQQLSLCGFSSLGGGGASFLILSCRVWYWLHVITIFQVERALKFWVDGDAETTFKATKADVRSFSESNHGLTTAKFMKSIKGLSDRAWTKILSEADAFVDDTLAPKVISSDDFDGVLTGRSCLFEADTDSESE